jgi:hypothetical protein
MTTVANRSKKRLRTGDGLWIAGAVLVVSGWIFGYFAWDARLGGGFVSFEAWSWVVIVIAIGFPPAVLSGLLRRNRSQVVRKTGSVLVVLSCLWMAGLVQWVHFGGFCLDPGDVCVVSWPSRIGALIAALACILAARAISTWKGLRRDAESAV